jgi:hypothetical protein
VCIAADERAHIQAVGRDAEHRLQCVDLTRRDRSVSMRSRQCLRQKTNLC